jgi:hypothetical protein
VMGMASGVVGGLQLHHGNLAGMVAGVAIGKAQIHATQMKQALGKFSSKAAQRTGWSLGKAGSLFNRKKSGSKEGGA